MGIKHVFQSTIADGSTTSHVRPSNWNADHTIDGPVTLSAGTTSGAPLVFVSGANLASPSSGATEYDGTCFYLTAAASARQVVRTEQLITQTSNYTGSTGTAAQKIFDASTGLDGALTVGVGTYMFEAMVGVEGRSTTSNQHAFRFGGTAVVTRSVMTALTVSAAASTVVTAPTFNRNSSASLSLNAANTLASLTSKIEGTLVVGTSGTLIPQISRSAGTVAYVTAADSYLRIWPIAAGGVNRIGHWS